MLPMLKLYNEVLQDVYTKKIVLNLAREVQSNLCFTPLNMKIASL